MSVTPEPKKALKLFYSYAHKDELWRKRLETHLSTLQRQGFISSWYDRNISAGTAWRHEIDTHLNTAHIILLLISPDFIASEYCYSVEMMRAMERHKAGEACVIPVILRPTDWKGTPFEQLQVLPYNGKPVTRWQNRDDALLDVARGIRNTTEELLLSYSLHPSASGRNQISKGMKSLYLWNVLYRRNPFFTGRENILTLLHDQLHKKVVALVVQPQALSGLGGVGKTQIAAEYAYRYRDQYHFIFWVKAASRDVLLSDIVVLANLLQIPEKDEQDQSLIITGVKRWLSGHSEWLLILDNADDIAMVEEFLPTESNGHILLTTRTQIGGSIAHIIEVEKMTIEEGALLLLRRAKLLSLDAFLEKAPVEHRAKAEAIVKELDGLPLALDQAGSYIEETQCSLSEYLDLYRIHRKELLSRRSALRSDHPEPVATTWSLSFQQVEQANPTAANLLRLCAFLYPDNIPEEIIARDPTPISGFKPIAADTFIFNEAIEALRKFSLIRRNPDESMLSMHRLVQAVLRDGLDEATQQQWAERAVRTVNQAYPDTEVASWVQCQRYLPQALICATLIEQYKLAFPEAARLLNEAGCFLKEHAQYRQAELLFQQALMIREKVLGTDHADRSATLSNLADLYNAQGQYEQAELLYKQVLAVRERNLGPEHSDTVMSLLDLAFLYRKQDLYTQAEPLFQQALTIAMNLLDQERPDTANSLNNLAVLFFPDALSNGSKDGYERAESFLLRALAVSEKVRGVEDSTTGTILLNLGLLYSSQDLYAQAEASYQRALAIGEKLYGIEDHRITPHLTNLAMLYQDQGRHAEAEPLFQNTLAIHEQVFDSLHPSIASDLSHLASCYQAQGKYAQAEPLFQRALKIHEQALGLKHPNTAESLVTLAFCYQVQGQYAQAEQLFQRALKINEQVLGPDHIETIAALLFLAVLYDVQKRSMETELLYQRIFTIWEQTLGYERIITLLDRFIDELRKKNMKKEAAILEVRVKAYTG